MTKKILACILSVCLIAALIPATLFAENEGIDLPGDDIDVTGVVKGDLDDNGVVDSDDAIYALMATLFLDDYPLNQDADFNGDGVFDSDDAIYLLMYTLFPDDYPLEVTPG